jgi:hypothetical protein
MKTTYNKASRRITDQFTLTGEPIGNPDAIPTLTVSTSHYKDRKAFVATISYVELEQQRGYAMETWQSDWPMFRLASAPAARYSDKALEAFRQQALQTLFDQESNATVAALLERIKEEVAA